MPGMEQNGNLFLDLVFFSFSLENSKISMVVSLHIALEIYGFSIGNEVDKGI
jgi:hypothetical protein